MKSMPLLFFGIFLCMAFSWSGLIFVPHLHMGDLKPVAMEEDGNLYPFRPSGEALQGKQVFIAQNCIICHSQQVRPKGFGGDFDRGWGDRQSVPRDYIYDEQNLIGTMRTGPDLANVGTRLNEEWHHKHLYNPQSTSKGSIMPPFRYLYRVQKIGKKPSPDALSGFVEGDEPPEGYEVVPTQRAKLLVAYLMSLKQDYELPESKFAQ